jgi:hypothetical protein
MGRSEVTEACYSLKACQVRESRPWHLILKNPFDPRAFDMKHRNNHNETITMNIEH